MPLIGITDASHTPVELGTVSPPTGRCASAKDHTSDQSDGSACCPHVLLCHSGRPDVYVPAGRLIESAGVTTFPVDTHADVGVARCRTSRAV